jgi:hypothetical protein
MHYIFKRLIIGYHRNQILGENNGILTSLAIASKTRSQQGLDVCPSRLTVNANFMFVGSNRKSIVGWRPFPTEFLGMVQSKLLWLMTGLG